MNTSDIISDSWEPKENNSDKIDVIIPYINKNIEEVRHVVDIFSGVSRSGYKINSIRILEIENERDLDEDYSIFIRSVKQLSDSNSNLLICKPKVNTNIDPDVLVSIIENVIHQENFDLFYLCKWMDRPDLYTNCRQIYQSIDLYDTASPNGFHCILFSTEGIRKILKFYNPESNPVKYKENFSRILNMRISSKDYRETETLNAVTTYNSLIQGGEFNEFRDPEVIIDRKNTPKEDGLGCLWVIVWIIMIFLLMCAFVSIRKQTEANINPHVYI